MPAQRPAAVFEPISPDLDLDALVEQTGNFEYVTRIPVDSIDAQGQETFEKLVLQYVVIGGKPLVIEGFQNRLERWTFSPQWLKDNMGSKFEQARYINKQENLPLSIGHYLDNLPKLANQFTPQTYRDPRRQRLYLKDIDCPQLWHDKLKEQIPQSVFYLNDCTGEVGGPGSVEEPNPNGIGTRKGRGIAKAGDLMSSLPPSMRAENMMCYIGHEGTYTPAHREMCASLGQNIMVEASGSVGEDGRPTRPGSSIWFMTESKDRHLVSEYWLSTLGHDIEVEAHFAQINAWKRAPFTVYIVDQKVGDFILIPPLAPHQVWNRGTRTMKAAWNRTTVETLEMALDEALPRARMVCRDEQYKNKAIVLFTLNRYSALSRHIEYQKSVAGDAEALEQLKKGSKIRQLHKDFKRLFALYKNILLSEMLPADAKEKKMEYLPYDSNVTCSYCRCNIFNRFLTCKACVIPLENDEEDTYDICMECYAMGRSCRCLSKLTWVEQFPWKDLLEKYDLWRAQFARVSGANKAAWPLSLNEECERLGKKTLAQVCQEQLKARPFVDPSKPAPVEEPDDDEEEDETNADGTLKKKKKKKRSEKWLKEHIRCHICCHREIFWKMAICSECSTAFCYGSLWRGFDTMPQKVQEDLHWKCPKCRKICNCTHCGKIADNKPYEPNGTVLGHDTRKFADPRSVESLVDFSSSNMYWLKKSGDDQSGRLNRRKSEAEMAKSQGTSLSEHEDEGDEDEAAERGTGMAIDPALGGAESPEKSPMSSGINEDGDEDIRQAAADALSRLEQDPYSFITQAGLGGLDGAIDPSLLRNDHDYEYPEPSAGGAYVSHLGKRDGQIRTTSKKKNRRSDYREKVLSNAALLGNDANRRFYTSQVQASMIEAKKTGRLIAAKAAITGDSLVIRLPVGSDKLARFGGAENGGDVSQVVEDSIDPAMVVQSDLQRESPKVATSGKIVQPPKKRIREEIDDEFGARKRRDTKSDAAKKHQPTTQQVEVESSDNSDFDFEAEAGANPTAKSNGTGTKTDAQKQRRSLPGYLARRSPVNDLELPKELQNNDRRRSHAPTAQSQQRKAAPHPPPPPSSAALDGAADEEEENDHKDGDDHNPPVAARSSPKAMLNKRTSTPKVKRTPAAQDIAELNRQAKLRAMAGDLTSASESDSPEPPAAPPPVTSPSPKKGRGRPPKNPPPPVSSAPRRTSPGPAPVAPMVSGLGGGGQTAMPERKSIFANRGGRGGKIRIMSAAKAATAMR